MMRNNTLNTLHTLAEKEVEEQAIQLGKMRLGHQQAEEQLNLLLDYLQEYSNKLHDNLSLGVTRARWYNYQQFMQTLQKTIDEQRLQVNQWKNKVDQALLAWQQKQQRLQTWQTLLKKKDNALLLAQNRLEQKQMDEYALRATLRKSV